MAKKKTTLNDLNHYLNNPENENPGQGTDNANNQAPGSQQNDHNDHKTGANNNQKGQEAEQKPADQYLKKAPHKLVEEEKVDPQKAQQAKQLTEEQILEQVEQLAQQNGEEAEVVLTRLFHSHLKKNFAERYSNLPTPSMEEVTNLQFSMLNMGLQYSHYVRDIAEHWFGLAGQYGFMPYFKDVFSRN